MATSELELHLGVYHRYDAGAVVHTHAPMATALACVLDELPVVHYQMLELGGPVRVVPYATFGTSELAQLTLDALSERTVALMANHGTIAHGADLDEAVERSLLLEWACPLYWRAAAIGTPRTLDERAAAAFSQRADSSAATERRNEIGDDGGMNVITLGVQVVDVLVRPVEEIPAGQGGSARRADPDHAGGLRGWHRDHAGEARRRVSQRRRDRSRRARRHAVG